MKVLIVCSGNAGYVSPFVKEQAVSITMLGNEIEIYKVIGKGVFGYLKNLPNLRRKIAEFKPDLIHAHYGLSGLLATLQRKVPVVITFHGCDARIFYVRQFSKIAAIMSSFNIFVSESIKQRINKHKANSRISCGVNLYGFNIVDKNIAREKSLLQLNKKYILFSSSFDNYIKNYPLAKEAIAKLKDDIELIELKNKSREEVNWLLNAVDAVLLTSFSEGSPQFIKEAMACNCPIVATDVGDIKWILGDAEGCFLTSFDPQDIAEKIKLALKFSETNGRTRGRDRIIELGLDSTSIAKKVINVYEKILSN